MEFLSFYRLAQLAHRKGHRAERLGVKKGVTAVALFDDSGVAVDRPGAFTHFTVATAWRHLEAIPDRPAD